MNFETLKQLHRERREGFHENLSLRVHRALSWLQRAEQCEDLDGRFIFLWISFNAAYATEILPEYGLSEQHKFRAFIEKLCDLDSGRLIDTLVWQEFPRSIRVMLGNPYIHADFWEYQRGTFSKQEWQDSLERANGAAHRALAAQNTPAVLSIVFSRIYTLRNQMMHGGATWDSRVNRDQMRDCVNFMGKFVPTILQIMLDNPDTLWGDCMFPVVKD